MPTTSPLAAQASLTTHPMPTLTNLPPCQQRTAWPRPPCSCCCTCQHTPAARRPSSRRQRRCAACSGSCTARRHSAACRTPSSCSGLHQVQTVQHNVRLSAHCARMPQDSRLCGTSNQLCRSLIPACLARPCLRRPDAGRPGGSLPGWRPVPGVHTATGGRCLAIPCTRGLTAAGGAAAGCTAARQAGGCPCTWGHSGAAGAGAQLSDRQRKGVLQDFAGSSVSPQVHLLRFRLHLLIQRSCCPSFPCVPASGAVPSRRCCGAAGQRW